MAVTEKVYLGTDNDIRWILKENDVAQDQSSTTRIDIIVGGITVTSTNQVGDPIRWAQGGYATGEIRMSLGAENLRPGTHNNSPLMVYDAVNTNGIMWDVAKIIVYGRRGDGPNI